MAEQQPLFGEGTGRATVTVMLLIAALAWNGCSGGDAEGQAADEARRAERPVLESCANAPPPADASVSVPTSLTAAGSPAEPVEVTFWHGENEPRRQVLHELVEEFARSDPSVTVHVEPLGGGRDGLIGRWREATVAERPSITLFPQEMTRRLADSMQTVAPGPCLAEVVPDLLPVVEAATTVDGLAQAVPFAVSTPVLFYNRDAFKAAGLDPDDPPATLDEMREASQQLVAAGVVSTGLMFNTAPTGGGSWFVTQWSAQMGELVLEPANGRVPTGESGRPDSTGEVTAAWRDGPLVEHLAWLHQMVADGLAVSLGKNHGGADNLLPLFDTELPAAMAIYTSPAAMELASQIGTTVGVAPLPGPGGPGRGSLPGGAALWLSAGKADAEVRAAWRLAAYLASPSVQARWAVEAGSIPISPSATSEEPLASTWEVRPQLAVPYQVLSEQATTYADLGMSAGPQTAIETLLAAAVDAVVKGDDPAETLRQAADDTDHLLAIYLQPGT